MSYIVDYSGNRILSYLGDLLVDYSGGAEPEPPTPSIESSTIIDILRERIRSEGVVGHTNAVLVSFLSYAQQLLNIQKAALIESSTIATTPRQLLYPLGITLPSAVDILDVTFEGRRLPQVPHVKLMSSSCGRDWFRAIGPDPLAWCQIGRSQLIIWPSCYSARTIDVRYVKLTDTLVAVDSAIELPSSCIPELLSLTEALLLLRQRSIGEAASILKEIGGDQK